MINSPEQIPYRSVYLAVGLLLAGARPSAAATRCSLPLNRCGHVLPCACCGVLLLRAAELPHTAQGLPPQLLPLLARSPRPASAADRRLLWPHLSVLPGLAMLISGLVLWRTEGQSALIGLWICERRCTLPAHRSCLCAAGLGAACLPQPRACTHGLPAPCPAVQAACLCSSPAFTTRGCRGGC